MLSKLIPKDFPLKHKRMNNFLWLAYTVNVLCVSGSLLILPERIATHFNKSGMPDCFGSSRILLNLIGIQTLLFVIFLLMPKISFFFPDKWINLPNKAYWLKPENRPFAKILLETYLWQMGAATLLLFLTLTIETVRANLADPIQLEPKVMVTAIALYMVFACYWCIAFPAVFHKLKNPQG
jgi:hypothetical protein